MPLLGKKIFDPGTTYTQTKESNEKFCIPHTKEVFSSESEYQERLKLYKKNIWTCQCTGHINLQHEEAVQSEKQCREKLVRFGEVWEKPLLTLVQHSFSSLDNIIADAYYMFMTQLMPGEKVVFTVAKAAKEFEATIVKSYETAQAASSETACSEQSVSPSSDKENKSRQALITDVFKTDMRRSSRCTNPVPSPTKGKKLKLLPAKYDILLTDENKIISKVPCEHLKRASKPPSRELIRFFIRANAVRLQGGREKLPWLVDEIMVFRHSIPPQISPEEEKRMVQVSTTTMSKYYKDQEEPSKTPQLNGHSLPNGAVSSEDDDVLVKEDEPLSLLAKSKPSNVSNVQKRKTNTTTNNKAKKPKLSSKSEKKKKKSGQNNDKSKRAGIDFFLKKVKGDKGSPKAKKNASGPVVISDTEDTASQTSVDLVVVSKKPKLKESERTNSSSRKNSVPKKKKQATLLELTKKGGIKLLGSPSPSRTSKSTPSKQSKPRQPPIILKLLSLKKEKNFRSMKYKLTVTTACKVLTEKQRANLPTEIKDDVLKKWNILEKKKKFKEMTDEEKRKYLSEQRKAHQKKPEKFEDLHLVRTAAAKKLPEVDLVTLPESMPNTSFGDVAMLCEFLHTYHALLCPKDQSFHKQFNVQSVTDAVTAGRTGFGLTRKILILLLQTLLTDDIAKDYCEIEYPLNQILVTPEVCGDLTRICLRQNDEDLDDVKSDSSSNADVAATGLQDSTSRRLSEMEIYEMEPVEQVEVLSILTYRVMNTYSAQSHMDSTLMRATTVWNKVAKQNKERKQEMKEKELAEKQNPKTKSDEKPNDVEVEDKPSETNKETECSDLDIDLVSRVKKRKMLSEKHRKEEQERKEKLRKEQDEIMEKLHTQQERERASRQLVETRLQADHVKRRAPLGCDRNHSRYWLFCDGVPGLYVEKGWIGDHVNYHTMSEVEFTSSPVKTPKRTFDLPREDLLKTPTKFEPRKSTASSDDDELPLSQISTPSKKKARFRKSKEEASWPRPGQNLWMFVDSQEALDELMKTLLRHGVRESKLFDNLKKHYDSIVRSMNKRKAMYERPVSDGPVRRHTLPSDGEELLKMKAKKNLQLLIRESCRGGLATVAEPDVFEQRAEVASSVPELSALLIELYEAIPKKCLLKYMTGVSNKKRRADQTEPEQASDRERTRAERRATRWKLAVEDATLYSRFCLLLAILNNSINWSMYQYRRVYSRRKGTRNKNYADMNEGDQSEIEEEEKEEEENEDAEESEEESDDGSESGEEEQDDDDNEEEGSESDSDEESGDEEGQRRSSRIRQKNDKYSYEEVRPIPRAARAARKRHDFQNKRNPVKPKKQPTRVVRNAQQRVIYKEFATESSDSDSDSSKSSNDMEDDLQEENVCRDIVDRMMECRHAGLFIDPVDEEDVPDYYKIIKKPMCLRRILEKIDLAQDDNILVKLSRNDEDSHYTMIDLIDDMRLIFDNAIRYNKKDSYAMKQAYKLEKSFVRSCREVANPAQNLHLRDRFPCSDRR